MRMRVSIVAAVCAVSGSLLADCRELRTELRAFYPKYGQFSGPVNDPRQKASCDRIEAELKGWMAEHPQYDALDLR